MKLKTCFFLLAFLTISFFSKAQRQWSEWIYLSNNGGADAYISFSEIKTCGNFGYCYYRLKNNKAFRSGSTLYGSFKYTDCDGKASSESFTVYLSNTGIDEARGYWYLSNGSGVYGITVNRVNTLNEILNTEQQTGEQLQTHERIPTFLQHFNDK